MRHKLWVWCSRKWCWESTFFQNTLTFFTNHLSVHLMPLPCFYSILQNFEISFNLLRSLAKNIIISLYTPNYKTAHTSKTSILKFCKKHMLLFNNHLAEQPYLFIGTNRYYKRIYLLAFCYSIFILNWLNLGNKVLYNSFVIQLYVL